MEIFHYLRWRSAKHRHNFPLDENFFSTRICDGQFDFWGAKCDRFGSVLSDTRFPYLLQVFWLSKFNIFKQEEKDEAFLSGRDYFPPHSSQ